MDDWVSSGYGSGDGSGDGYGYGYGDGSGSGDGYGYVLTLDRAAALPAYHWIAKHNGTYRLRSGETTVIAQHLHVDSIKMCERGLHASLTAKDAKEYAPANSVLTKVLVWGQVQFGRDKLVATDRMILEEVQNA